jgi:CRISPR/Cas system-associated endoribonuclease Cas2
MSAYIICYDLKKSGQNYDDLLELIRSYGTYWHMQGSVWIIQTNETTEEIRIKLSPAIDSNDELFVGQLSGNASWEGYSEEVTEWVQDVLGKN